MKKIVCHTALALTLFSFGGCGVATQNIPISTNPSGATVFVDGTETCTTPCNATLEKTQDHLLTIQKEGYNQADVQVTRKYDTAGVARDATQSGMEAASHGSSTEGAIVNALISTETSEAQGTAYVLSPSTVSVQLVPQGQIGAQAASPNSEGKQAVIKTTEPTTLGSTLEEHPEQAAEALLEAGAAAAPTIHAGKTHTSSHSSESMGDGTYTKETSSTSVSGSVSVNPVEAGLDAIKLLEGAEKDKGDSADPAK
ncbi:MAG: PEGA domain-containing protein [Pseudodesulfovibrio sp.]